MAHDYLLSSQSSQELCYHACLNTGVLKIERGLKDGDVPLVGQRLFDLSWERVRWWLGEGPKGQKERKLVEGKPLGIAI